MKLLLLLMMSLAPLGELAAHSPWGQYQVYRAKHMLILSTRQDDASYPFSKELVTCLEETLPSAHARPARAISLMRAFNLLRTDQFQFAVLPKNQIDLMRANEGKFKIPKPIELQTLLAFADLQLVVRADFPAELVELVTHHLLQCQGQFSYEMKVAVEALDDPNIHPGASLAITEFLAEKS